MISRKFVRKYFEHPDLSRKEWCVTAELGSVSFWVETYKTESEERAYGGIEHHYNAKSKPKYLEESSHHLDCEQNGGECWHDGSSLWASEYWIPNILPLGDERIFEMLELEYEDCLGKK